MGFFGLNPQNDINGHPEQREGSHNINLRMTNAIITLTD